MKRVLRFSSEARQQLNQVRSNTAQTSLVKQLLKTLALLETNPRHPGLHTHEFTSLKGPQGEKVFEAYAQNNTPGAWRVFFHYGPDEIGPKKEKISILSILAMTPHP